MQDEPFGETMQEMKMRTGALAILLALAAPSVAAPKVDPAVFADPVHDTAHPARMAVVHIPSGGVEINAVVYVAASKGPHPVVVLCHGLPGNEKNLDLAQAIRRAGWTVVTFNYRGSWGSPGTYSFANDLADVDAVLAYVRAPENAARLRFDPKHIVLGGHSLGGWATALTVAHDNRLAGAFMISPGNLRRIGKLPREQAVAFLKDNGMESLATTPEAMADELIAQGDTYDFVTTAPRLTGTRLLVLTSDDGGAPAADALVAGIRANGGKGVTTVHAATDHSWSDARVRLASELIGWLRRTTPSR
ncbi:S9 family peptidase [Sphingomonas sp. SUN039]|uniref:alpha/beta hydrolase family protein n=1 Tax=Sphingomonas sp. SUN039 TaxID=2937787 RepID=UPI002164D0A9|nr:alpha/beta hydrolase [Sphingomonas sp. SUN039]UVO54564.1 alpha/beta fold hydrolase [Sphingomonas sp. SUN039]